MVIARFLQRSGKKREFRFADVIKIELAGFVRKFRGKKRVYASVSPTPTRE
jgi:hypothetical protein